MAAKSRKRVNMAIFMSGAVTWYTDDEKKTNAVVHAATEVSTPCTVSFHEGTQMRTTPKARKPAKPTMCDHAEKRS